MVNLHLILKYDQIKQNQSKMAMYITILLILAVLSFASWLWAIMNVSTMHYKEASQYHLDLKINSV
jgi:hypothetical protein